jgi:hypothetical protein
MIMFIKPTRINLKGLDDETERSNEGGACGLVFFGMQAELAFGTITR